MKRRNRKVLITRRELIERMNRKLIDREISYVDFLEWKREFDENDPEAEEESEK